MEESWGGADFGAQGTDHLTGWCPREDGDTSLDFRREEQGNLSLNGLLSLVCRWWQGGSLALGCSTLWGLCSESKSCVVKKKPVGRASSKTFGEKPQGSRHQPGDVSFLKKLFKMKQWETEKQLIFQYISLGDYICINLYMYFLIKKISNMKYTYMSNYIYTVVFSSII